MTLTSVPPPDDTIVLLPSAPESEDVICGALLINPEMLPEIRRQLEVDDFMPDRLPRRVYETIIERQDTIGGFDIGTVFRELMKNDPLSAENLKRFEKLTDGVPKSSRIAHHVTPIQEAARKRRMLLSGNAWLHAISNGNSREEQDQLLVRVIKSTERRGRFLIQDIGDVVPREPQFSVDGLIRRGGLTMFWGTPGAKKTWITLEMLLELMTPERKYLFDNPELAINRQYKRVGFIGTEESPPIFRSKLDRAVAGLGIDWPQGFFHLWASDPRQSFDLSQLPAFLDTHGHLDALALDSLTGLRPPMMNGQPVKWDIDNDANTALMNMLRGQAEQRDMDIILLHHTGRDTTRYRGAVSIWAGLDVQVGLVPDDGRVKLMVEKNRDGAEPRPFMLNPQWHPDGSFTVSHDGAAFDAVTLTPTAVQIADYLGTVSEASQSDIVEAIGATRQTVRTALAALESSCFVERTGRLKSGSPVFKRTSVARVANGG